MNKLTALLAATTMTFICLPAIAQETPPTLRVDRGSVMTSDGGEFAAAQSGKVLVEGERVMVTEGAAASVVYDTGCVREYTAPGVYAVQPVCVPSATATGEAAIDWGAAGLITAGVAIGAAVLASMDDVAAPPPPPVSR